MRADERHIRPDSLTSQFRALAKQKPRKRQPPVLEPLPLNGLNREKNDNMLMGTASLQKQVQSPIRLQWLVDDFVKAAGAGDTEKVDQYIRGGIPIDRKHSVLQYSALHAAAALESNEITKVLVQAGANVNGKTKRVS
uniref:Uncharacterized protein n=1 Tax=Globisporangium ultimum (strain ATCC 200006 / CBS 805.95 / DAOM BR144) TaxID=431595 RepID=K3X2B5_GLOUD